MCVCRERAAKQHDVKFTHNLIRRGYIYLSHEYFIILTTFKLFILLF